METKQSARDGMRAHLSEVDIDWWFYSPELQEQRITEQLAFDADVEAVGFNP